MRVEEKNVKTTRVCINENPVSDSAKICLR